MAEKQCNLIKNGGGMIPDYAHGVSTTVSTTPVTGSFVQFTVNITETGFYAYRVQNNAAAATIGIAEMYIDEFSPYGIQPYAQNGNAAYAKITTPLYYIEKGSTVRVSYTCAGSGGVYQIFVPAKQV